MADGLKGMLTKVLQNKGRKKFFFAYGTGKRTDGQGDGHLIVANGKKPKRPDIEEECACSAFIEGRCWSSTDGGTLFFLGKSKLAQAVVAKMALTARKLSGKQYDFQVPSPEEETRSAALAEDESADGEALANETANVPPTPPAPPPTGLTAQWKAKLAKYTPAIKEAILGKRPNAADIQKLLLQATTLAKPGGDVAQALVHLEEAYKLAQAGSLPDAAPKFTERLKTLLAEVTNAGGNGEALKEIKLIVSEAQVFARKQDHEQANATLDRLEGLLQSSARSEAEAPQEKPTEPEDEETIQGPTGKQRYELEKEELQPEYERCLKEKVGDTNKMRTIFAFAEGKAGTGEFTSATKSLDLLRKLIEQGQSKEAERPDPAGKSEVIAYRKALVTWRQAVSTVTARIAALKKAAVEEFPDAGPAVAKLDRILKGLDDGLIEVLDQALVATDDARREELHEMAAGLVRDYLAFVRTNKLVKHADNNEWLNVEIEKTLGTALTEVGKQLGA